MITCDGEQTVTTSAIKRTLCPYWNESLCVSAAPSPADHVVTCPYAHAQGKAHRRSTVKDSSVVTVQIFDQKKFKRKDQGFLGVINVRISSVLDLDLGGDETLTRDLKKSNDNLVVHGKLIIHLSTNTSVPIRNAPPAAVSGSAVAAAAAAGGSASTSGAGPSDSVPSRTSSPRASSPSPAVVPPVAVASPSVAAAASSDSAGLGAPPAVSTSGMPSGAPPSSTTPGAASASGNFNPREDQHGPLPAGWERRVDHLGRTYYVDHNMRRTTWTRPQPGSVGHLALGAADMCSATAAATTQQATEAAAHEQRAVMGNRTTADDFLNADTPPGVGGSTTPVPAAAAAASNSTTAGTGPLPAGWEQRFTPEGRPYFVDQCVIGVSWPG